MSDPIDMPVKSTATLPSPLFQDSRLPASAKVVAGLLEAGALDRSGWCFPKQQAIADTLGLSLATVGRAIAILVKCGYVEVRKHTVSGKGLTGLEYRVLAKLSDETLEASLPQRKAGTSSVSDRPENDSRYVKMSDRYVVTPSESTTEGDYTTLRDNPESESDCLDGGVEEGQKNISEKPKRSRAKKIARPATDESMPREISHEMREIAERQNYSKTAAEESFACWRDWHISKGTEIAGHNASYSMWLRNAKRFAERDAQKSESDAERDRRARRTLH